MRKAVKSRTPGRYVVVAAATAAVAAATLVGTAHTSVAAPARPDAGAAAVARADAAIQRHRTDIRASGGDAFQARRSIVDKSGAAHVRYTRTYRGLRVYGGDFVVHTGPTGAYAGASVGLRSPLTLGTTATVEATAAATSARATFEGTVTAVGTPELFVDASRGSARLAWETVVEGWAPDRQTPSRLHVISDAVTGAHIGAFDEIEAVNGTGYGITSGGVDIEVSVADGLHYEMTDGLRGGGYACDMNNTVGGPCVRFYDGIDNVWGNGTNGDRASAAVDAHYGAAVTYDYFKYVHGRNGIFGNGVGVPSRVHYGQNYVNAFWNGSSMTYGDGAGNARPLISLDVAGHEMAHGVTANVVPGGLNYFGESGGLNEASSDIFGSMVEFYAGNVADAPDYLIGERIDLFGNGDPLRYMYNPALDGNSDSCWSTSTGTKDVHYSSGVGNHFFFNLAEGTGNTPFGLSPICGSAITAPGIGRDKAQRIWYRALDVYFTSTTSYVNTANPGNTARAATLQAATDLYGFCSLEYRAVQRAWWAVNVNGGESFCPVSLVNPGTVTTVRGQNSPVFPGVDGGYFTYTYSASGYPTGMQFEPLLGVFYGAATVGGTYFPTVTVTDAMGQTASISFTWVVNVKVPDLRGMTVAEATAALQSQQLVRGTITNKRDPLCESIGRVMSHSPSRNTTVAAYTTVNITVGIRPSTPCL